MLARAYKQIIIGAIFVAIVTLFGFLIYKIYIEPKPSCFDGIQNQNEEGIDCGGVCEKVCLPTLNKIEVYWATAIPAVDNYYNVAARLRNPNQNYGTGKIPYQFKLYNASGQEIAQRSGLTYILPNQTKYLVQTRIYSSQEIVRAELILSEDIKWQKFSEFQEPNLTIKDKAYYSMYTKASGVVINNSNYDFDKITVDVLLFDANQHVLSANTTEINTLLAGGDRHFIVTLQKEFNQQIDNAVMEVETNVFNSDNFMKRFGVSNDFRRY